MMSRDKVRKFASLVFTGIHSSTKTKTKQFSKYNLGVDKLRSEEAIVKKRGFPWPICYYHLINRKRIGEAILS